MRPQQRGPALERPPLVIGVQAPPARTPRAHAAMVARLYDDQVPSRPALGCSQRRARRARQPVRTVAGPPRQRPRASGSRVACSAGGVRVPRRSSRSTRCSGPVTRLVRQEHATRRVDAAPAAACGGCAAAAGSGARRHRSARVRCRAARAAACGQARSSRNGRWRWKDHTPATSGLPCVDRRRPRAGADHLNGCPKRWCSRFSSEVSMTMSPRRQKKKTVGVSGLAGVLNEVPQCAVARGSRGGLFHVTAAGMTTDLACVSY